MFFLFLEFEFSLFTRRTRRNYFYNKSANLALSWQMIPALAMDRVCCSITSWRTDLGQGLGAKVTLCGGKQKFG